MAETVETAVYKLRVEGQDQIDRATRSVEGLATAEDKLASANRTTSASMQRSIAQLDPLIAAQEKYLRALRSVENARKRGVSESQLATRLALEKQRYDEAAVAAEHYRRAQANAQLTPFKSAQDSAFAFEAAGAQKYQQALAGVASQTKLSRYELINLSRQVQDVGVSLFSGQGLFTVLVQQGSQIFDVFASSKATVGSFFSSAVEWAGKFLTPMNMAIGAVVSFGAAAIYSAAQWATAQKEIERSLIGIGAQSGATAAKINAFAHIGPSESIAGLSPGERREVGTEFARTGAIDVSQLKGVTEALRGYAIIAGKDATEATKDLAKVLGGDLVKGIADLEKTYGALDPRLKDTVQNFLILGERAKAQQALLDAVAEANRRAADTITPLSAAWRGLTNVLGMAAEGYGALLSYKVFETAGQQAERVAKATADAAAAARQQENKTIGKGIRVVEDYTPEIQQIEKLNQALADLKRAKEAAAAAGKTFDDEGAEQKIINQIAATQQAMAAAEAYAQTVARVSAEWRGVSESAAMALHTQESQLKVIEAIGGAAQMAAQYAVDYQTTWEKTGNAIEAANVAAMNMRTTQAQINASAQETLWALQNQAAAAAAVTDEEKRTAEAVATRNKLIHDGVDGLLAQKVASQQLANATAAANVKENADLEKQSEKEEDRRRREKQQEQEAEKRRSQALARQEAEADAIARKQGFLETQMGRMYDPAIVALYKMQGIFGDLVNSSAVLAQNARILANNLAAGADSAVSMNYSHLTSQNMTNQVASWQGGAFQSNSPSQFDVPQGTRYGSITTQYLGGEHAARQEMYANIPTLSATVNQQLASGGVNAALSYAMGQQPREQLLDQFGEGGTWGASTEYGDIVTQKAITESEILGEVQSLFDLQRSQTGDKGAQLASYESEIAWLQSRPASVETQKAITQLRQSIDSLTKSTDSLNSTNQDLLSPYYTQDPRTSHIGFRSQGMANGGYVDVPGGYSANDNLIAEIPVASGERIYVDPNSAKRGGGGGSLTINISSPVLIQGNANKDDVGRTMFQANQSMARQIQAALR